MIKDEHEVDAPTELAKEVLFSYVETAKDESVFFFCLVNYAITNYEKYYIDDITVDNSTYLMKIHA